MRFRVLARPGFAISARFTVQIHRSKASHGCRIATLGDTDGLACRNLAISAAFTVQIHASGNRPLHSFCHLCSFHRADPRFTESAPTLLLPSLQLSPCRSTLHGFGTRGEEIESPGPPCRFMLQGFCPRDKRASLRVVSESADSTVQMHASGLWP